MSELFESGIRPAIDKHLLKLANDKRDYANYWSASSAGYCMRKVIFDRLNVPHTSEDDPRLQRVFTAGHIFHSWIQGLTKEAGISVAQEVELQDEKLKVRGHFDDLVKIDGKLILYDYKSANSKSFSYMKNQEMSWYHRLQLGTYMYMLRQQEQYEDLTEGRILKISKDDLRLDEQQLLWTPELEQQVIKYWAELNQCWESKVMPPCTCDHFEGGFMSKPKYNNFYYKNASCSIDWFNLWKGDKQGFA